jgi:hypothetical protein
VGEGVWVFVGVWVLVDVQVGMGVRVVVAVNVLVGVGLWVADLLDSNVFVAVLEIVVVFPTVAVGAGCVLVGWYGPCV